MSLKRNYTSDATAGGNTELLRRLTLLIEANSRISDLKRLIEREFSELFPYEPPYIVAKLDDEQGYSLSNSSRVGDFLKYGDKINAVPETQGSAMHGGGNTTDLVVMLRNLESSIVGKIA